MGGCLSAHPCFSTPAGSKTGKQCGGGIIESVDTNGEDVDFFATTAARQLFS